MRLFLLLVFSLGLNAQIQSMILETPTAAGGGGGGVNPSFHDGQGCQSGLFSCTISLAVTTGDFIFDCTSTTTVSNTFTTPNDSVNTYTVMSGGPWTDAGNMNELQCWTAVAASSATISIVNHVTLDTNYMGAVAGSYTGATGTPTLDKGPSEASNASGMSFTTGASGTTTVSNEVLIGVFSFYFASGLGSFNPGTGYTERGTGSNGTQAVIAEDNPVSSTGNYTATATTSGTAQGPALIITIK